jgi:copper(I)-binding protein
MRPTPHARAFARLFAVLLSATAAGAAHAAAPAPAKPAAVASIEIRNAWARPTPPGAEVGAAYFEIHGRAADRLLEVVTPAARRAEIHTMSMQGDVMQMRRVDAVPVPAGRPVVFAPGGLHVMLLGLARPLAVGERVPLQLKFEKAGTVNVDVTVKAEADAAGGGAHRTH